MKQFFASILIAFLAATGLVAAGGSAAQAAPCPYTGCFETNTNVSGSNAIKRTNAPRVRIAVLSNGNAKVRGTVKVIYRRVNGGFYRSRNVYYSGDPKVIVGPKLFRPGKYEIIARYQAQAPFKASGDSYGLLVRRR